MAEPGQAALRHTALHCFAALARHHGVDLAVERLIHDHALGDEEPDLDRLVRIARTAGFRARAVRLAWADLAALGQAFPVLARLHNGNSVILAGFRGDAETGEVAVLDPLSDQPGFLFLDRARFERSWTGQTLFVKRTFRLGDEDQPFGLRWFVPELLRQRRLFTDVGVAALAMHALALAVPIFFQIVVDKVLVHESYATLYVLVVGIAIALMFDAVFNFLRRYLLLFVGNRIDVRVSTRTFGRLLRLPIDFFDRMPAGVLVKHMQQAENIRQFLTGRLFLTLLDSAALLVFLPVLLLYSVKLTFVVLAFSAAIGIVIFLLIGPFRRRLRALYTAEGERQAFLVESIQGMSTVKAAALEPGRRRVWDSRAAQAVQMQFRVGQISAVAQATTGLFEKLMIVAVIGIGAQSVFDGALTVGAVIAFQMIASRVSGPLVQIVSLVHEYQEAALSVRMLGEVMNRPVEGAGVDRGLRPPITGRIEFEGVTFRYGANGAPALDNVSFVIPAGTVFGLVGRSGSGKTTVTRLMQGMYTTQAGVVRIDGYDVRELDLAHLRTSVGVVLQDSFLFRGTVRENIGMTKPDATFEEIVAAARLAGADEFVQQLPKGYDTLLEENGRNLSGGQRQRLAIARALLPQPPILILDEATSALDPESEAIVQENLARIAEGRTVVMVSHRLSALVQADAILVLDRGRVVDVARHGDLLGRCTTYRQLWNQQTRHLA